MADCVFYDDFHPVAGDRSQFVEVIPGDGSVGVVLDGDCRSPGLLSSTGAFAVLTSTHLINTQVHVPSQQSPTWPFQPVTVESKADKRGIIPNVFNANSHDLEKKDFHQFTGDETSIRMHGKKIVKTSYTPRTVNSGRCISTSIAALPSSAKCLSVAIYSRHFLTANRGCIFKSEAGKTS